MLLPFLRPLFFISLFLVTSARSFRQELKKKKIDHWSWAAKFDLSRTWSCAPTTTSSASEAYRFSLLQVWQCQSLPCCGRGFIEVPVCTSCVPRMLCEGGACSHSRAEADAHLTARLGDWLGLGTEMCMITAKKKTNKSLYFCVPVTRCCVRVLVLFFGGNYFFSVRSVAFRGKMWRETEIKITVA